MYEENEAERTVSRSAFLKLAFLKLQKEFKMLRKMTGMISLLRKITCNCSFIIFKCK